ncbi:MAG: polysaccharide pyruvyl transferase family protein [Anaerosomatales bacterium]|nr:polysaccharide pyruvyl transferase family protein [Anaerosomatales bacterium]
MKVGVITFHRALNYGAVLQAYALQQSIERLGYQCEIVDYQCQHLLRGSRVLPQINAGPRTFLSGVAHAPLKVTRHVLFRRFRSRHLRTSLRRYDAASISEANAHFDTFVVGSDQVWNPALTGDDDTYLLAFCNDSKKKISYAASLGRSEFQPEHEDRYLRQLSSFDAISVRELDSSRYLSRVLKREVPCVLDPVFLLPTEEWIALSRSSGLEKPYIFVYCLHEESVYRYAEHVRRLTGLPVVHVPPSLRTRVAGTRVLAFSPEEFLGWIRNAAFVITDSFHALAFSVVFSRPFKAQMKLAFPELNSRMSSLLSVLGLEEQVLSQRDYESTMPPVTNYADAMVRLAASRQRSLKFLEEALRC